MIKKQLNKLITNILYESDYEGGRHKPNYDIIFCNMEKKKLFIIDR